ncbi:MAG: NAD-dependent protein deacylase [Burkholderiales bacterium]|nr:NAD-dependent protein deacylase [Burkholderiales bacterium]
METHSSGKTSTPRIVILTGAGISAESGIPTFRASDGLWEQHRIEDVATPEAFSRRPQLVQTFYNERRRKLLSVDIKPNPAHIALGALQRRFPETVTIVTQNIDNLHERGGAFNVLHMHGELLKVRCVRCATVIEWARDVEMGDHCAVCGAGLRPHIVWFGEMPFYMDIITDALRQADLFVSIGTSGNIYPAAGFVAEAKTYGAATLEINLEPSGNRAFFDEGLYGRASEKVPEWVNGFLQN